MAFFKGTMGEPSGVRSGINSDLLWLLTSYDSHTEIRSQTPIDICPVLQRKIISVSSGSINNSQATVLFAADQPFALFILSLPPPDVREVNICDY